MIKIGSPRVSCITIPKVYSGPIFGPRPAAPNPTASLPVRTSGAEPREVIHTSSSVRGVPSASRIFASSGAVSGLRAMASNVLTWACPCMFD